MSNTTQCNIVVCGSPRVGKTTLINALCQTQVTTTSDSLNPHSNQTQKYILKRPSLNEVESNEYYITIYDTPGIESWTKEHIQKYFNEIMTESQPICMIYCASPGSFARLDHLRWLIDTCIQSNIFCALVCTNKYAGGSQQRKQILDDFDSVLSNYQNLKKEENEIIFYGEVGLRACVNSIPYEDTDLEIRRPIEGLDQLIFAILKSLKNDKAVGWIYTISQNESFWSNMSKSISTYYGISHDMAVRIGRDYGKDIAKVLIPIILNSLFKK